MIKSAVHFFYGKEVCIACWQKGICSLDRVGEQATGLKSYPPWSFFPWSGRSKAANRTGVLYQCFLLLVVVPCHSVGEMNHFMALQRFRIQMLSFHIPLSRVCRLYNSFFRDQYIPFVIELHQVCRIWGFRTMVMKGSIFWDITPCSPLKVNRRCGGTCVLHLQGRIISRARN
jgi:hypothetical protein